MTGIDDSSLCWKTTCSQSRRDSNKDDWSAAVINCDELSSYVRLCNLFMTLHVVFGRRVRVIVIARERFVTFAYSVGFFSCGESYEIARQEPCNVARRQILVVGYPKSGNTWVTRLTAELLGAPVRGFWREPGTREIAVEGTERSAPIDVFKGHHPCKEVTSRLELTNIVYVARDVRDVAVSGAHYFSFRRRTAAGRASYAARWVRRRMSAQFETDYRVRRMLDVLAVGDSTVSEWCTQPWDEHVLSYVQAGAFVTRYESLLYRPEDEARRLLNHLGVQRTGEQIRAAVLRQSFGIAKQRYLEAGEHARAASLRRGREGDWRMSLTTEQQMFCWRRFGPMLAHLGYGIDGFSRQRETLPCVTIYPSRALPRALGAPIA